MRSPYPVTRAVLVVAVLAGAVWLAVSLPAPPGGPETTQAIAPPPPAPAGGLRDTTVAATAAGLLAPDIQALWDQRRRRLDDLSRRYRAATDSAHAAALRCSMERLIDHSEREVLELRLAHARRVGRHQLVRRLERALADLPPPPGSDSPAPSAHPRTPGASP